MTRAVRIQRSRAKGWRTPENAIYVGRPSRWGNPFVGWDTVTALELFGNLTRGYWDPNVVANDQCEIAYQQHRAWLKRLGRGHPSELIRSELCGHDLACWCPLDAPCHADVLLELANGAPEAQT